jgi:hypothetical protein
MTEKHDVVERLRRHLAHGAELRRATNATTDDTGKRQQLRTWQSDRLARTHGDFLEMPRYRAAARFFMTDLYGPCDFGKRCAETEKILPLIVKILPVSGLEVVASALELDAVSESLDADMVKILGERLATLNHAAYAESYRQTGRQADRQQQIQLIEDLGLALERLTRLPVIKSTLHSMHTPATLIGLGELQSFLERGFNAFVILKEPSAFMSMIIRRERALSDALFNGRDDLLAEPASQWGSDMVFHQNHADRDNRHRL